MRFKFFFFKISRIASLSMGASRTTFDFLRDIESSGFAFLEAENRLVMQNFSLPAALCFVKELGLRL